MRANRCMTRPGRCSSTDPSASVANAAGVPNPIGNAVKNSFASAVAAGKGEDYVPMLSDFIAERSGVSLGKKG